MLRPTALFLFFWRRHRGYYLIQIDQALFTDGGGKGEQSNAISAASKAVREAFVVPEGEEADPENGRYSRFDVDVSTGSGNAPSCVATTTVGGTPIFKAGNTFGTAPCNAQKIHFVKDQSRIMTNTLLSCLEPVKQSVDVMVLTTEGPSQAFSEHAEFLQSMMSWFYYDSVLLSCSKTQCLFLSFSITKVLLMSWFQNAQILFCCCAVVWCAEYYFRELCVDVDVVKSGKK